ncbi:MAG TPA: cell division protein FtsQ/DivIB [Burkholderiales bacterium]|nr:cell division protein FtsQ/DivIB [Burkholderiales bacterium]
MWDSPRLLNLLAGALVGVAMFLFAAAGIWALVHSDLFPVREVTVANALEKTTRDDVESALHGRITGNFFAVSAADVRAGLEKLPWVRRASVRRVWPDRLDVTLEEHVAVARWGDDALVNTYGERFSGMSDDVTLPLFVGPAGTEHEVALRYGRFSEAVAPLEMRVERIVLTPRLAWQLRLSGGLDVMLGRDGEVAEARLKRFVEVFDATLKTIPRKHEYVDLRYPNGFALRVPGLQAKGS